MQTATHSLCSCQQELLPWLRRARQAGPGCEQEGRQKRVFREPLWTCAQPQTGQPRPMAKLAFASSESSLGGGAGVVCKWC